MHTFGLGSGWLGLGSGLGSGLGLALTLALDLTLSRAAGRHLKRRAEIAREIEMGDLGDLGDLDQRAEAGAQRGVRPQREGVRVPG